MNEAPPIVVGVVADTHVPDRVSGLPPGLTEAFRSAGVSHILHAGDVCARRVLDELAAVAPVCAARGNRDFLFNPPLPMANEIEVGGVRIGICHGHGGTMRYWLDKFGYVFQGYRYERYLEIARGACPRAHVWVYGHSHRSENRWVDGRLLFNPGAATGFRFGTLDYPPTYGLLRIYPGGRIEGEVLAIRGWRVRSGDWVPTQAS